MPTFKEFYSATGEFKEKKFGHCFEYRPTFDSWAKSKGFEFELAAGDGSVRYANIKKTVAYVCIDESDDGTPITEKWSIKTLWVKMPMEEQNKS